MGNLISKVSFPFVMFSKLDSEVFLVNFVFERVVSKEILEGLDEITHWGSYFQLKFDETGSNLTPWRLVELFHL
jgi:hypothetical protein